MSPSLYETSVQCRSAAIACRSWDFFMLCCTKSHTFFMSSVMALAFSLASLSLVESAESSVGSKLILGSYPLVAMNGESPVAAEGALLAANSAIGSRSV